MNGLLLLVHQDEVFKMTITKARSVKESSAAAVWIHAKTLLLAKHFFMLKCSQIHKDLICRILWDIDYDFICSLKGQLNQELYTNNVTSVFLIEEFHIYLVQDIMFVLI